MSVEDEMRRLTHELGLIRKALERMSPPPSKAESESPKRRVWTI